VTISRRGKMFDYESFPKFKAAAVQAGMVLRDAPEWFDIKASLDKVISLIDEAGRNGARLIVFPEGFLPGHPHAVFSMGTSVLKDYHHLWVEYLKHSIEVPGPEVEALGRAAKKAGAYVVMGINERDKRYYGAMYNTILFLNPRGEVVGTHRKISNTVTERLFHAPGQAGNNLRTVFPTELGRLGGSICNEHSQYLLQYYWVLQGLEVHASLWPGLVNNKIAMQARVRGVSACSGVFNVAACAYIPPQDYPPGFRAREEQNPLCGGSGICSPQGEYITGPVFDEETIVYGEVDLAEIPKKRAAVNLTGIYSRWDILSLNVRQQPFEPIHPMEDLEESHRTGESERVRILEERIKELERLLPSVPALKEEE
jgi:predicted amidohydrolase